MTDKTNELEGEELVPKLTEFETKYRVEPHMLTEFKKIVGALPGLEKFIYVEGPDYYFTKSDGSFARYRRPSHGLDNGRSEVTVKVKPEGAKNNIIRKEVNWRVDETPEDAIREGLRLMGYTPNFSIWKGCHIYNFHDVTLVMYQVFDTTDGKASKTDSFVEIEVSEEKISEMTEDAAWDLISKYEAILSDIGINAQKRLRKSLFEMYRREQK
jgi:adenylate cyclase class IV